MQLKKAYDMWIFNAYSCTPSQLGLFRIVFTSLIIFFVGIPQFSNKIIHFPDGFFNPPPLFGQFFSNIPPIIYFEITDIILFLGFFCILIGFLTKICGIISATLSIINFGFIFSTGKIDHSFIVWFTLLIMSFSGWEKKFSIDCVFFNLKNLEIRTWLISFLSLSLGFAFFTSGLIKLISGWLGIADSMVRGFYLRNYYVQQKQDYLAPLFENFSFKIFWELGDWFTILFEMGFLIAVFHAPLFRCFTVLAVFFHGTVMLMMNIAFGIYLPLYLLFWAPLIPKTITISCKNIFATLTNNRNRLFSFLLIMLVSYTLRLIFNDHLFIISREILIFFGFFLSLYILLIAPQLLFIKPSDRPGMNIIQFDGVCNLCNGFVQFVINRDKKAYFKFATLQDVDQNNNEYETIILKNNNTLYKKSTAFLEISRRLNGPWPYLYLFILIPKPLRDFIYSTIAKNRYRWFGQRDTCMVPTPDLKNRFI